MLFWRAGRERREGCRRAGRTCRAAEARCVVSSIMRLICSSAVQRKDSVSLCKEERLGTAREKEPAANGNGRGSQERSLRTVLLGRGCLLHLLLDVVQLRLHLPQLGVLLLDEPAR